MITRLSPNIYFDSKYGFLCKRGETVGEHISSSLKLADYFLHHEPEFQELDPLHVKDLILYHDDLELITGDDSILDLVARTKKKQTEKDALPVLLGKVPNKSVTRIEALIIEYGQQETDAAKFAYAIDKWDPLIHGLDYPEECRAKGFTKELVKQLYEPAFEYSPTFRAYFKELMTFFDKERFFETAPEKQLSFNFF